jgi:tetratricopeptide (TPR) repeat protein
MEMTKKEAFIKQLAIYIRDDDYQKAHELGLAFVARFPGEMASHFLLARAAFALAKYEEAKLEARKAFNMAQNDKDLLAAALLAATAHFQLGQYAEGYELLRRMEGRGGGADYESAMVVFSLALRDKEGVVSHLEKLHRLNERLALELAARIISKA